MSLFFKPAGLHVPDKLLYTAISPQLNATISFRSLRLPSDINFLYEWVNQPYAKQFWQMEGSKSSLYDTYAALLDNPNGHSFIGLYNGSPVCQIDLYSISTDELKGHVTCHANDCGFHFLMLPPKNARKGLSVALLKSFCSFYFSFPDAAMLYGEPDVKNVLANRLALKAGLRFVQQVQLSSKTANLYSMTKQQHHETIALF